MVAGELIGHFGEGSALWFIDEPKYWVYPLQTVVCAGLLAWWWKRYDFAWSRGWWLGLIVGGIAFAVWIAPQEWISRFWQVDSSVFSTQRRVGGYDLWFFGGGSDFKWNAFFRIVRLVIVVPLLEEIFWRGFLLRHLIHDPFDQIRFGTRSWFAFAWVAGLFAVAHWGPDLWPALITGALYNAVAFSTRSLGACVIAHATTNLALGLYIFRTQQWGFW